MAVDFSFPTGKVAKGRMGFLHSFQTYRKTKDNNDE